MSTKAAQLISFAPMVARFIAHGVIRQSTWHPDYKAKKRQRIPIDQLVRNAQKTAAEFVVITGGEPTIHELNPLVNALHQVGLPVHLETSGAFAITADFDWITLSPKRWKHPLQESVQKADELKIIVIMYLQWLNTVNLLIISTLDQISGCNPSGPK